MKRATHTTYVSSVFAHLKLCDDFRTAREVAEETRIPYHNVSSALYALRDYGAVAAMAVEGRLFWFATPDSDTRIRTIEERAYETAPRRARRRKVETVPR